MSDNKFDENNESNQANDTIIEENDSKEISLELGAEDTTAENLDAPQHVVVRKGSFISSLAFLMSLAALLIAAYLFYLQQSLAPNKINDLESRQQIKQLAQLKDENNRNIDSIKKQIQTLTQDNQKLKEELKIVKSTIEVKASSTNQSSTQNYDDSEILAQLAAIEDKLSQTTKVSSNNSLTPKFSNLEEKVASQQEKINQLNNDLSTNLAQQKESIAKLSSDIAKKNQNQTNLVSLSNKKYPLEVAQTYLRIASIQLNTNGNISKAKDLLSKTQDELRSLKDSKALSLANELSTLNSQLEKINKPNVEKITKKINSLSDQVTKLEFESNQTKQENSNDDAWYNKLVVVRKIDDKQQTHLTKSDLFTIMQSLQTNFDMLKVALLSQNQDLFNAKIDKINTMLDLHFQKQSQNIKTQLSQLKEIELNPKLPDLSLYLEKIQNLVMAN